ncbi:non-hydrolyzing UDP-N-acetylglucosamine 2-epimerase [Parasphingopyxis marina]|uniref:UDP-N-acetylglucosamine 2-epimerase (non-hydrolyzing) n=1 Tax=Parasphingopyxis marina TaxID=2761622 RepID=A0A842I0T4_9SPHN|nr:UDP-N-acetylglucosamine 2-epimerase (non-hydrolyzing) [Parasphingopyxis marina]MBC2778467.1 UDP-N-acetylglucosamine 2-epimerase (non-hydrolyzing) [Parasphingopyxis marina]
MKILIVFGTRPEAIKMAPVVKAFQADSDFDTRVCVTGQHREMLDQVLELFAIKPDIDLNIMTPGQSLTDVTVATLTGLEAVLDAEKPDAVLVHGDTTSAMAAAMAAFYRQIPVGHVEAGLRTRNLYAPWPEEMNRGFIDMVGQWLFAPTEVSREALLSEQISPGRIFVTGNTVIDALLSVVGDLRADGGQKADLDARFDFLDSGKRLIVVTGHRRENFDGGLERMCGALARLASRGDVEIVYPVHLNENVQRAANAVLSDTAAVHLIEPQDYLPFVYLMDRAHLLISDSGGIQEEAPSLGKPVLVTRDVTERPEAIAAGTCRLVGTDPDIIVSEAEKLLDDETEYARVSAIANPYGDGKAADRIVKALKNDG